MTVRTRMAPSPTGEFHIGGMRTLLYNYALAKKTAGQFVLRIEDTDRERLVEGATERLIQVIRDYGLSWDEGPNVGGPHAPYVQSKRLNIYKKYAEQLVATNHAYYCFCTKGRLEHLRESQHKQGVPSTKYDKLCLNLSPDEVQQKLKSGVPYVIRLNVPNNSTVEFDDSILGHIAFPSNDVDDQVLLKSDGFPTYHLAVVVDDYLMEINTIMRGVEWLPSTAKHILLYKAFGWPLPVYAHLPLLKEKGDTKKLSKRMGSVSATEFLSEGYLPKALLNMLMFLGWNPGTEKELYTLEEFINDFSIEKIHKTDLVVFDRDKLLWYNGYYIRNMSTTDLLLTLRTWAVKYGVILPKAEEAYDCNVLDLVKDRIKKLSDYMDLVGYFYKAPMVSERLLLEQSGDGSRTKSILNAFVELYMATVDIHWTNTNLDSISHQMIAEKSYKPKEAFMTLRVALTGQTATPPVFDIAALLGKKEVLTRLQNSLKLI